MSVQTKRQVISRTWRVLPVVHNYTCTHSDSPHGSRHMSDNYQACGAPATTERYVRVRYFVGGHESTVSSYFCEEHARMRKLQQPELPLRPSLHHRQGNAVVESLGPGICIVRLDDSALVSVALFSEDLKQGDRVAVVKTLSTKLKALKT